jgi:hypothetical protein
MWGAADPDPGNMDKSRRRRRRRCVICETIHTFSITYINKHSLPTGHSYFFSSDTLSSRTLTDTNLRHKTPTL